MVKPNIKALSCSWIVWLLVSPTFSPWNHCPVDTGGDNAGVSVRFPGRGTRGDFKFVPIGKRNRWPRAWKSLSQHKQTYRKSEFLRFWLIAPEENSLYHQFSLLHVLLSPYFGGFLITFHPTHDLWPASAARLEGARAPPPRPHRPRPEQGTLSPALASASFLISV